MDKTKKAMNGLKKRMTSPTRSPKTKERSHNLSQDSPKSTTEGESSKEDSIKLYRSPSGNLRERTKLQVLWFMYAENLRKRPLISKALNAFVISTLSNAVSQIISKRYKFKESLIYGLQCCPPYSHFVYQFMDRVFWGGAGEQCMFF